MKRLALVLAVLPILLVRPAHADTLDFTWQSTAWVKTYESPTQFTITGPFTLSGQGSVTFAELVTGGLAGRTLTFGAPTEAPSPPPGTERTTAPWPSQPPSGPATATGA